ncbi:MAG: sulfotransferase [Patescibacteria group bacterium]|nr:sulfotransferase [Patescibacteria group bacterium]MCP6727508.1 sulfotransferase [Patescibacteria group bacterium]
MNKTIVVFGQSRSGTTVLMEILHNLGVSVGELFMKTKMNRNGSYEELGIGNCLWRQERRLFPRSGEQIAATRDKYVYELQNKNDYSVLREEFRKKVVVRNKVYDDWAFKNPVFIHQWRVLTDLLENPHFIIVKRNLESNAKSFSKWTDYSIEESLEIINFRNTLVDAFIKETTYPKIIVNYEELIENVHESIQKIADFVGRKPTEKAEDCIKKEAKNF